MTPNAEYQAIAMGPEEVTFKQENHGKSRFLSLVHLTPPKAVVLATAIVCITFAAIHIKSNRMTQNGPSFSPRLDQKAFVPGIFQRFEDNCEPFRRNPLRCLSPFLNLHCQKCKVYFPTAPPIPPSLGSTQKLTLEQNGGGVPIAPHQVGRTEDYSCDYLSQNMELCYNFNFDVFMRCKSCNLFG